MKQSDKEDKPKSVMFMMCISVGGVLVEFYAKAEDKQKAGHAIRAASKMLATAPYVAVEEVPE